MTAKLFMNPNPVILRTSDTIAHGAEQIMAKQRRELPVVDDEGRFQGMLTANCLLYLVLPKAATMEQGLDALPFVRNSLDDLRVRLKKYLDKPITLCLTRKNVAVVHPDTPMLETLLILYRAKANLPVVEKNTGKLVGTISYYSVGAKIMEEGFD
jgi:CBS domain-containing protein